MSKARGLADLGNAYSDGALSNRNVILNGSFQVWQRGTSGTTGYVADRFITANTTSVSKVSSSLTGFGSAMRIVANSSDPHFVQHIENTDGYLAGQTMTLSFWMKSDIADPFDAGQYCQYNDGSEVDQLIAVDVPSVIETNGDWKRYSRTFTLPTTATGSKFNARIDFNETTGQTLDITGVQLEIGDTATPFEHRSYGQELALCQRYYEASGAAFDSGNYEHHRIQASSSMAFTCPPVRYKVTKRATPTVTIYGANGVSGKISVQGTNYDYSGVFQSGRDQFSLYDVIETGWFGYFIEFNWVADAEL